METNNEENKNPMEYTGGYWKQMRELSFESGDQKLIDGEFVSSPLKTEDGEDETSRRDFLKLMGASIALGATGCIRRPVQKIIPYAKAPEEIIPGVANYYASSWTYGGEGYGLLMKTREGRPIKIEGNPSHPINQGGLSSRMSAQILALYDPDRLQNPSTHKRGGSESQTLTWDQLDEKVLPKLKEGDVVLLSSSLASPSTSQIIGDFFQGFKGRHVTWDPLGAEDIRLGQVASYGSSVVPRLAVERAKYILSVDCDLLGTFLNPVENMKGFSRNRTPTAGMSKLVAFESIMSLTGMNADFRVRIKPSQQVDVLMGLAHEIVVSQGSSKFAGQANVTSLLKTFANAAAKIGIDSAIFKQIASDLWKNKGQSLVVAGGLVGRTAQADQLQIAVNFLNALLENDGKTIDAERSPYVSYQGSTEQLATLIEDMNAGKVKTLLIHRLNMAYLAPKSSGFVEALGKVGTVIYTGAQMDETAKLCDFVAPDHHDFENWGDTELQKGVFAIQQPTVRPLYNTRSLQSSLMNWAYAAELGPKRLTEPSGWYEYLQNYWKDQSVKMRRADFQSFWTKFLQDGVVNTSSRDGSTSARNFATAALGRVNAQASEGLELVMYEKIGLGDGSFANIAWLQELPDPVSKIVWDNYLVISPKRAKELGLRPDMDEGKVLRATTANGAITLPVHIQPGAHDEVVGVAVGYGRSTGSVAAGIGTNVWSFAGFSKNGVVTSGLKVEKLEVLNEKIPLANTQGHHYMEGRPIVAEATLADYQKNEKAGIKSHEIFSMWPKHSYTGYRWGMAIDLNTCTGCSACVTACQSENNIPVVGKQYVMQGREMHWMRIDRYYNGDVDNPQVVVQPMLCQHCENAPCETVCPVVATVHSSEGTNDMVYNRCVGTRYCANNCPYKVRRFNWFNYSKVEAPMNMAFNPDVTVRVRGVMEKCSFCVQRIHGAKDVARAEKRKIRDGDVKTACQQACPTDAIVFGDMNDGNSQVSKLFASKRTYMVLDELNALPSVRYQTKIRNTEKLGGSIKKGHRILRGEPS